MPTDDKPGARTKAHAAIRGHFGETRDGIWPECRQTAPAQNGQTQKPTSTAGCHSRLDEVARTRAQKSRMSAWIARRFGPCRATWTKAPHKYTHKNWSDRDAKWHKLTPPGGSPMLVSPCQARAKGMFGHALTRTVMTWQTMEAGGIEPCWRPAKQANTPGCAPDTTSQGT